MEDRDIVELYWRRDQAAIDESARKYGRYCYSIAYNILGTNEDADESVNDTWMGAWKSMPPNRPRLLNAFLGKITRYISLNKWRDRGRKKRGGGEITLVLDELEDCVSSGDDLEQTVERRELIEMIDRFLADLTESERNVFVRRYWYLDPVSEISALYGFSESKVKTMLFRTRNKLRDELEEVGYL